MSQLKLLLAPASDLLSAVWFVASLLKYSEGLVTLGVQLGFVNILLFLLPCAVRRHPPVFPVTPRHERFRLTLLFKPFLMKSTQKWNWLMPNEYHWIAVIVEHMFVTGELFIKHQFHLKSSDAMKCTDIPKVSSENAGAPEATTHHHHPSPSPGETITRSNHHQVKPSPEKTSSPPASA